jgi:hypothetical protein
MPELNQYFKLYCEHSQRKRPQLPDHIETCLNNAVSGIAGHSPLEMAYDSPKPDTFKRLLPMGPKLLTEEETPEDKAIRA